MASTRKKQIPALQRKKVTASARARVSTSRVRKSTKSRLEESFIQSSPPSGLSDPNHLNLTTPTNPIVTSSQSDVMIDMLRQLTQSNQSLLQRVEKIEQQGANFHHTTAMGAPPTRPQTLVPHSAPLQQQNSSHHTSRLTRRHEHCLTLYQLPTIVIVVHQSQGLQLQVYLVIQQLCNMMGWYRVWRTSGGCPTFLKL